MSEPVRLQTSKWRRAPRNVEPPKPTDRWFGGHYYQAMQYSAGGSNNSQRCGHKTRWYVDRQWRISLGKHGIFRLRQRLTKAQEKIAAIKTKAHGQADLIKGLKT